MSACVLSTRAIAIMSSFLLLSLPGPTQAQGRNLIGIQCSGRDTLVTSLTLDKFPPPRYAKQDRLTGFLSQSGIGNAIQFDFAVELQSPSLNAEFVRLCGISFYTTDATTRRSAYFEGRTANGCLVIWSKSTITLAIEVPPSGGSSFHGFDSCQFSFTNARS